MVKQQKLEEALQTVRGWLELLVPRRKDPPPDNPWRGHVFWEEGEGTVFLTGDDETQYKRCLGALLESVADTEEVGARAIRDSLNSAILAALDLRDTRDPDPAVRITEAVNVLRDFMRAPRHKYRVMIPVDGLANDGLPSKVGQVEFALYDEARKNEFKATLSQTTGSDSDKTDLLNSIEEWSSELGSKIVGIVEVEVSDWDAARLRAIREVRLTLDLINFFADFVPYNQTHLRQPGDVERARFLVGELKETPTGPIYNLHREWVGPAGELSLARLRYYDGEEKWGFGYASNLLNKSRNKLQDRLLAALQWAGRASIDTRREEAFLLYAIALEAFLLAEGDKEELSYRLRLRVAHLLGASEEDRRVLFRRVGQLYGIRSQIVHSGTYQVSGSDLGLVRWLAIKALLRACSDEEFQKLTSPDDLVRWFDAKILS